MLHEVECAYEVRVRLEHIRSERNVVADHLSHGKYAEVKALFAKKGIQIQQMEGDQEVLNGANTWLSFTKDAEKRVTQAPGREDQGVWESSDEEE